MSETQWATIEWRDESVVMLDQRLLPQQEVYEQYTRVEQVADAIRNMVIRSAPAIGIAAAMGVALAGRQADTVQECKARVADAIEQLARTRPTAVNLFWALDRMKDTLVRLQDQPLAAIHDGLLTEALTILEDDVRICELLGKNGAALLPDEARVLTHCNAGALATGGYGTALGVIRAAVSSGKRLAVLADETRPYLQGARLTAWELQRDGIDVTVITDSMAGHLMSRGEIDCVIVGSDRTTANGDVANKIGTYTLAVLCKEHGIPFYAAVPISTIDLAMSDGSQIPIEERPAEEVTHSGGTRTVPVGVQVRNPAFDVTPSALVTAIITERGVAYPPYSESLLALFDPDLDRGNS